ncbi:hypothetical protein [Glycomyces buryatensis]|uniref:Uncharacterized protein n=1 Tax=Glycomyces buryatensis TaxID=2570927 RepID=A0A4S8QIV4_9ACTN|nr:hypothetical protein [Glycomyces buryatensis]THV43192.1 hypothetical protein FAB82_02890 [Glycomyces buryatensis]
MTDTQETWNVEASATLKVKASRSGPARPRRRGQAALIALAVGALASLGGVLYSLYRLTGMSDGLDQTGLIILANSLFSPIIVTAFAGAVGGVAVGGSIAARLRGPSRALIAAGFCAVGLLTGAVAYVLFSVDAAVAAALGAILFASAVLGGLFSLPRARVPVIAGLVSTMVMLAFMYGRGLLETSSVSLFSDPLDEYGALGTAAPFVAGLVCGLVAFGLLRGATGKSKLPGYLFAGAMPGAIWLVSTIIAQAGVEIVLGVGDAEVSSLDSAYLSLAFQSQYNGSMTAMFAGALCSVLAYGLLIPKDARSSQSAVGGQDLEEVEFRS